MNLYYIRNTLIETINEAKDKNLDYIWYSKELGKYIGTNTYKKWGCFPMRNLPCMRVALEKAIQCEKPYLSEILVFLHSYQKVCIAFSDRTEFIYEDTAYNIYTDRKGKNDVVVDAEIIVDKYLKIKLIIL